MKALVLGGLSALLLAGIGPFEVGANAQVFSSQRTQTGTSQNGTVQSGTAQSVPTQGSPTQSRPANNPTDLKGGATLRTTLEQDETLYLDKTKTYDYDLVLRTASTFGSQRLPVGAVVRGRFEPADGGLIYRANSVEVANQIYRVEASSELLRDRKDPRQTSTGAILTDAAIGAAGGYVLSEVLGDASVLEVLGGAATGVIVGNTTAPFVVVISPDDPILLFSN